MEFYHIMHHVAPKKKVVLFDTPWGLLDESTGKK